MPVIDLTELTRWLQLFLGFIVLAVNLAIYRVGLASSSHGPDAREAERLYDVSGSTAAAPSLYLEGF